MTPFPQPIEPLDDAGDHDPEFLAAFQQLALRLREGEPVDEAAIRRDYPAVALDLIEALPGLCAVTALAAERRGGAPDDLTGALLADFKIVRHDRPRRHGGRVRSMAAIAAPSRCIKVLPSLYA